MTDVHRPFLLTGASGWFGRTALWEYEQAHGAEALRRDVLPFASRECWVEFDSPHGPIRAQPLSTITDVPHPRGLLHLAFLTRDKVEELGMSRYVEINRSITATVARLLRQWPTMPVVTTSSGAAAALDSKELDLEGNPYATLKQEEEQLLERESDTRMSMVFRVYAASGRFMTRPEKFALGDFLLRAMRGESVQVRSPHPVIRSYVNVEQMMCLAWRLLSQAEPPLRCQRLDACTMTLSLVELAQAVADNFHTTWQALEGLNPAAFPDYYVGDGRRFEALLLLHQIKAVRLPDHLRLTAQGLLGRQM